MEEMWRSLYLLPPSVFGILVFVAVAIMLGLEGILAVLRQPRRETRERKLSRSRSPVSAPLRADEPKVDSQSESAVASDQKQGQSA